jgi:uncharacterized protein (TIGR03437 family)
MLYLLLQVRQLHIGTAVALGFLLIQPAFAQLKSLNFEVVDAQYSRGLDRVIMVSAAPNQLIVYDPFEQQITGTVPLPLPPSNVSISPDGLHTAVGHNAWISYIDLTKPTLVKTIAIACDVLEALIGGGDYIYALPRRDQWTKIYVAQISTGADVTPSNYYLFYAGTLGRITNDGTTLYAAQNGLSPDHMQRFDVSSGAPKYQYDWQYHGTYYTGGNLWFSEDNQRIFARSGSVFRISSAQSLDMTYNGQLSGPINSVAHSTFVNRVFALPSTGGSYYTAAPQSEIDLYDYQFLASTGKLILPHIGNNGKSYAYFGQYVFTTNDGKNVVVIMQADRAAGLLNDFAALTISATGSAVSSANFWLGDLAPEEIVSVFGSDLASGSSQPASLPVPTIVDGTTVTVTDSTGQSAAAPLFYVSPSQVNFKVPGGTALGHASFTIQVDGRTTASGGMNIAKVSPGLYAITGNGQGPLAGYATQGAGAEQVVTNAYVFDSTQRQYVTNAIPYTGVKDPIVLVAYGTGIRGSNAAVKATIDGIAVPVAYSGPQGTYDGLDQVNIGPFPTGLRTNSDLQLIINADGQASNSVALRLK